MYRKHNVRKVLLKYVQDPNKWFYWYHNTKRLYELNKDDWQFTDHGIDGVSKELIGFFDATLDEVRLKKANSFAEFALYISDDKDLGYFRDAVSKKEFAADVDYNKQRDHAVHTLYNYILGWYIFDYNDDVFKKFCEHFEINLVYSPQVSQEIKPTKQDYSKIKDQEFNKDVVFVNHFGDVWPVVSLLHDIGYILEGTLSSASPQVENDRVTNGSKLIHDYFNHWFWKDYDFIDFRAAKNIARSIGCMVADFKQSRSLASLGDHLCDIGSCENIRKKRLNEIGDYRKHTSFHRRFRSIGQWFRIRFSEKSPIYSEDSLLQTQSPEKKDALTTEASKIQEDYDWNRDAFSLWKKYYKVHNNHKMKHIIIILNQEYKELMWKGTYQGYRSLNHGVCSGLILLQAFAFFFDFMWGCERFEWTKFKNEQEKEKFWPCNRISEKCFIDLRQMVITKNIPQQITARGGYNTDYFYRKALWATASTAIHDFIQSKNWKNAAKQYVLENESDIKKEISDTDLVVTLSKIGLNDDPLAFLGILVDILQQWDRYSVSGESAFSGIEPVQSNEVTLKKDPINNKILNFRYPNKSNENDNKLAKDLLKDLDRCLMEWKEIVNVL